MPIDSYTATLQGQEEQISNTEEEDNGVAEGPTSTERRLASRIKCPGEEVSF